MITDVIDPEVAAREMGWKPQSEFKGDPARWVDAETYLERAETVLPIVKASNARLQAQLEEVRRQNADLAEAVKASRESLDAMEEGYAEDTKRKVEQARLDLKAQIKAARESGDVDVELELQEELTGLNTAEKDAKATKKVEAAPAPAKVELTPEHKAWEADNPWYRTDIKKARRAFITGQEIAEELGLKGKAFYAELDKRLAQDPLFAREIPADKVEGARNGGGDSGSGAPAGQRYSDLPADAKAACAEQAKKLVGKGRRYETMKAWQDRYAEIYFRSF